MTSKNFLEIGGWVPINREMANALGNDAARVYAELLSFKELHKDNLEDGWFYLSLPKLAQRCGLTRRPLERSLKLLQEADLLLTVTQGLGNLTHYKLAETIDSYAHLGRSEKKKKPVQSVRKERTVKTDGKDKQAADNVQLVPSVCTDCTDYILNQEDKIEILNLNTKSEDKIARNRAASSSKKNEKNEELEKIAAACVENLNTLTGRRFEVKEHNTKLYKRLLVKGATFDDVRIVHELKTVQWLHDAKMKIHLCPTTLTRECNFWGYLDFAKQAQVNPIIVRPAETTPQDKHRQQSIDRIQGFIAAGERLEARKNQSL